MSKVSLCLHHELVLLLLDDAKGNFKGGMYQYGMAGAVLSELLLQGLIKVAVDEPKNVDVLSANSVGDPLLDDALKLIKDSNAKRPLKHWVAAIANMPKLCQRVAGQLCDLGILKHDETKVLWIFTRQLFPEVEGSYEDAIRKRMADVMFTTDVKADERTAVLVALAKSAGALTANFAPVQLTKHAARISEICEGKQLASGATIEAIESVQAAMIAIQAATTAATIATITAAR